MQSEKERQKKLRLYRHYDALIEEHRYIYNMLSASILAMDDTDWAETQKYARPAEVLESVYILKKGIEPQRYRTVTEEPLLELTQLLNAFCSKWHAILFYPTSLPASKTLFDEGMWNVKGYTPYQDDELRADDDALRENCVEGHITFNDAAFIGKGFIPVFWEEADYVRNRANARRIATRAEMQRLEALNQAMADEMEEDPDAY